MQLFSSKLSARAHMEDAFIALHAKDSNAFFFDRKNNSENPFSIIGASKTVLSSSEAQSQLAVFAKSISASKEELPFDFRPGLVGFYFYEGESQFLLVDRAMVFDHKASRLYFVGVFESKDEFTVWEHAALLRLGLIGGEGAVYRKANVIPDITEFALRHSDAKYLELIDQAKASITRGDAYQLCLTNQIALETSADPYAVFLRLREINPSPYSSYLRIGNQVLVSASPEQFLRVAADGLISTKPIKGTRPRDIDPVVDAALAVELQNNEKERAENLMIVDLMRNDLGRVSKPEDVVVSSLFEIESYATVHQLVSTIQARLLAGLDVFDAVKACFPAGSMTGAPKLSAMSILEGLESGPRGLYSGVFGYISYLGAADLAMTIRSIVFDVENALATIGIGGGLTIDSDPRAELEETKLKAKVLLRALGFTEN